MRHISVRWKVSTLAATLGVICPAFGQPAGSTPPPGDPNVVTMFLTHYDSLASDIRVARQQNTATADLAEQSAAKSIGGLTVSDFRTIGTIYSTLRQQLQSIDAEGNAYVAGVIAAQQAPDSAKLRDLATRRQAAVGNGIQALQNNLSPAGWTGLSSYLDGEFRKGITRRILK